MGEVTGVVPGPSTKPIIFTVSWDSPCPIVIISPISTFPFKAGIRFVPFEIGEFNLITSDLSFCVCCAGPNFQLLLKPHIRNPTIINDIIIIVIFGILFFLLFLIY